MTGAGRQQAGVVLPVILILLVILGVLATSGMDDTAMQERMAGNLRDREIAFQAAESALRAGETWLGTNSSLVLGNATMSGQEAAAWVPDPNSPPSGWPPSGWLTGLYGAGDAISLDDDPGPAFYVGPPMLLRVNPGEVPPKWRQIHNVTARSPGATDTTVVTVRSTFEPLL